jgi:protein TonB
MPGINIALHQDKQPADVVVRIEIEKPPLLPDIDVMGEEKKLKETVKEEKPPEPEPEEEIEEVIAERPEPPKEIVEVIDPQDDAILRYQDMVKRKIQVSRRYPPWAKKQGFEGIVHITFVVLSNGEVKDITVRHSSGFKILDREAIATIKRASPFPLIPKNIHRLSLQMDVSIVFKLT